MARAWSAGDLVLFRGDLVFIRAVRPRASGACVENIESGTSNWCMLDALTRPTLRHLQRAHRRLAAENARVASLQLHVELAISKRTRR